MYKWNITYTTKSPIVKPIVNVELLFPIPNKLTVVLYVGFGLSSFNNFGQGGKTIQLNSKFGNFRCDDSFLEKNNLPSELDIAKQNKGMFILPFVCNNFSSTTNQKQFLNVLAISIIQKYNFDLHITTEQNLDQQRDKLKNICQNKDLEFNISRWQKENSYHSYYGINGNHLNII